VDTLVSAGPGAVAAGVDPGAGVGEDQPAGRGWRPPRLVVLATVLFGLVGCLWTVAVPAYRAPDEAAHVDLTLYLAAGHPYPRYDGRYFGEEVGLDTDRYLIVLSVPWPRFDAADAPPRGDRPDVDELGIAPDAEARRGDRHRAGYPYVYNQMPQHPPLYYLGMAGLLRVERALLPGDGLPSLDRELALLRLANVALVLPVPLLAWATARRMGAGDRAAGVAALLPLCLPQFAHIGAAVNNDNLLTLLGGMLAVLLTGVARGRRTRRTDLAVGVVLGLALLTKAFAVMLVPWVAAAYAVGAWTTRRRRESAVGLAVAGAGAAVVGGWWWVANWVREGQPAPTTETLTRTTDQRPPGFHAEPVQFLWTFAGRLVSHTWAWVGFGTPKFELPRGVVAGLTLAVVAAVAVALRAAARGRDPAPGPRRVDVALAWLPAVLVGLFVVRRAWGLYDTTARFAFIQGRYLFEALVAGGAVVAFGATRALGRWAAPVVLAVGVGLQGWVLADVVAGSWSGPGALGVWRGMLAWSPWPPAVVIAVAAAAAGVAVAAGWTAVRVRADG